MSLGLPVNDDTLPVIINSYIWYTVQLYVDGVPKGEIEVELFDLEQPLILKAEVMWSRRLGFRRYEVGLNFVDIPSHVAKQLTRVSLNHRLRRMLGNA